MTFNHSDVRGGRGIDLGYGEMGTITQVMHQDVANAYAEKICDRSESERIFKELGYDIDYDSINGNHESSVHNISMNRVRILFLILFRFIRLILISI